MVDGYLDYISSGEDYLLNIIYWNVFYIFICCYHLSEFFFSFKGMSTHIIIEKKKRDTEKDFIAYLPIYSI